MSRHFKLTELMGNKDVYHSILNGTHRRVVN